MVTFFAPEKANDQYNLASVNYSYEYPSGIRLKPLTKVHDYIKDRVIERARFAYSRIKRRHSSWREMDKVVNGFIWADEIERNVKRKDPRKPISIVVPMTYATLEAKLTYYSSTFLVYPYFRYAAQGPEDRIKALLLERIVDSQMLRSQAGLALHTQFRDNCLYGLGAGAVSWKTKYGNKLVTSNGVRGVVNDMVWEGNKIDNINPYRFLIDPNVSIHAVQDGEYVGWITRTNFLSLLNEEQSSGGSLFNCRYLRHIQGSTAVSQLDESDRDRDRVSNRMNGIDPEARPLDIIYMYIKIIPFEWGLGSGEYPETWLFGVAGDQVVIMAEKVAATHNMFPVPVMATGYSGYEPAPISSLETVYGLQELMNFQVNSYIANKRTATNNRTVFNPSIISQRDVTNSQPGGLIRSRRTAWQGNLKDAIFMLPINDVTQANIPEMWNIWQMAERATVSQALLGERRQTSERVTATEVGGERDAALSKLEREFKIAGMQAMYPYAYILAHNTKQYMQESTWVKLVGREEELLKSAYPEPGINSVMVYPEDIGDVDFDIIPHDMRSLRKLDPNVAVQLFQAAANNQILAQEYDIGKFFNGICAELGAEEIQLYRRGVNVQVTPDSMVAQQQQAGNLVPITGGAYG